MPRRISGADLLARLGPAARAQVEDQLKKPAAKPAGSSVNKFGVAKKEDRTLDGITFDSKLEARVWKRLSLLISPSRIERQVPFELVPKQEGPTGKKYLPVRYVADFVVDGKHVLDAKGMRLPDYVIKKKLLLHLKGLEIRELKNLKEVDQFVASLNNQTPA